jgi:hypothetical protein
MRTFLGYFQFINESDTSDAFKREKDLSDHLKKHGAMNKDTEAAGSTGGNDFHIEHPTTRKKVAGKEIKSIRVEGEMKKSVSTGKFGSVALRYHPQKGWHIPEKTQKDKPEFTKQVHDATVTGPDKKKRKLLNHLNHHWGPSKEGVNHPGVTSDTTDMSPAHAYMHDHNVHVVHIGDRGTFRAGHSKDKDHHNTGLPILSGTGRFSVSSERKRTSEQQKAGTGMQINFRPHPNSVKKSHTDISTDEGIKKVMSNMSKRKK